MGIENEPTTTTTPPGSGEAGGTIDVYDLVRQDGSDDLVRTDAVDDTVEGAAADEYEDGDDVGYLNRIGVTKLRAGESIDVGDELQPHGDSGKEGRVRTDTESSARTIVGVALQAADGDGALFKAYLYEQFDSRS